jgi:hypothetical protein
MTPQAPYPYAPPTAPRKSNAGKIIVGIVTGVLAVCIGGSVIAAIAGSDDPKNAGTITQDEANRRAALAETSTSPSPAVTTTAPAAKPTTSAPAPKPTKTTKPTPPPVEIGEGVYLVGEDIPAGRYKVIERADSGCYWSRTRPDSDDIIDNSLAGGFPAFTAKKGEQVEIGYACPPFRLVKRK